MSTSLTSSPLRRAAVALLLMVGASPSGLYSQQRQIDGVVDVALVEDFRSTSRFEYSVRGPDGRRHPLRLTQGQVNGLGGARGLAGQRVAINGRVTRAWVSQGVVGAVANSEEVTVDRIVPLTQRSSLLAPPQVTGNVAYAVIGCKYQDIAFEPSTPTHWASMVGGTYPGLDNYFREVSNNAFGIAGSAATQWVTLPHPRAYYNDAAGLVNRTLASQDCLTAADPFVSFASFGGVILHFNEVMNNLATAWLGPISWTVDGQLRPLRTVVMPSGGTAVLSVWAHEMLHSLGLLHSSGSTANAYTSWWDAVSNGARDASVFGFAGNVGPHTIAGYKALLGWIPSPRIFDAPPGSTQIALERSALPTASSTYLIARIRIPGTNQEFTAEARRFAGYDQPGSPRGLPGEGVVIHRMPLDGSQLEGATADISALVVDGDFNGDVNDAGAIWLPGETFNDASGVSVRVDQAIGSTGYLVTVTNPGGYQLQVTATGTGSGRITSNVGGINCYYPGNSAPLQGTCTVTPTVNATVTLSQVPDVPNVFMGWSGDCSGASCTVGMDANRSVGATFAAGCPVDVQPSPPGSGTAVVTAGGATGICGRSVTITATPATGFGFQDWQDVVGGIVSTSPVYTFVPSQWITMTARFQPLCSTSITANPTQGGTVAFASGGATGICGRSVTVTATPSAGYLFLNWTEGGVVQSPNASYTFIDNQRVLVANFAAQCAVGVSANPGVGGTAAVTAGGAAGTCGRSITVTATPAAGYAFVDWTEGGVSQSTSPAFSFTATIARTLVANFAAQCAVGVSANPGVGGTATVTTGGAAGNCGRSVTVTAMPAADYAFVDWTEGGVTQSSSALYSFTANASRALVANFVAQCAISVSSSPGAGGTASVTAGGPTGACSRSVTVTATAAAGFAFVNWTEGGVSQSTSTAYTFTAAAGRALVANFAAQCSLTVVSGPGGSASQTAGSATGTCGRSVTVTATPSGGNVFQSWSDGATASPYTFSLNSSVTLLASFSAPCTVAVLANPGAGGTVAVSAGGASGACGRSVSVTATPTAGYVFVNWTEGGVSQSTNLVFSATVSAARTFVANFVAQCALTVNAGAGGTAAQTIGSATGNCGRAVTVTATPNAGNAFQAWSDGSTANPYTLTLTSSLTLIATFATSCNVGIAVNPPNSGTATITSGGAAGACGRSVTVNANAAPGFAFKSWTDEGISQSSNPLYAFVASVGRTLVANFVAQCTLTLTTGPGGTVAQTAGSPTGECGRGVTVVATPAQGSSFQGWSDGAVDNPYSFALNSSQTLMASFGTDCAVQVAATPPGGGTALVATGGNIGACGRSVMVTATAAPGFAFVNWTEGGVSQAANAAYNFTINTNRSLTAVFVAQCSLAVSVAPAVGGTAVISAGGAAGNCGRSVTVTATASPGFVFLNWTEGGVTQSSGESYSFVLGTSRILAANVAAQCSVTVAPTVGGTGSVTLGGAVGSCGRQVTVTALASAGYLFINWTEGSADLGVGPVLQLTVSTSRSVVPAFLSLVAVVTKAIDAWLGTGTITAAEANALDRIGNNNGRLDLADVLSALDDSGASLSPAVAERLDRVLQRIPQNPRP